VPRARGCTVHRASIARSCSTGGIRAQPPCQSELAQPFGSVRPRSADSTSGRRGREFKSPPPDQVRGGFRCWCRQPADSASAQRAASSRNDRPHCRQHRPAARHPPRRDTAPGLRRRVWHNPGAAPPALRPPRVLIRPRRSGRQTPRATAALSRTSLRSQEHVANVDVDDASGPEHLELLAQVVGLDEDGTSHDARLPPYRRVGPDLPSSSPQRYPAVNTPSEKQANTNALRTRVVVIRGGGAVGMPGSWCDCRRSTWRTMLPTGSWSDRRTHRCSGGTP